MKVAVVSAGFEPRNLRLQPHRTLLEMGKQLALLGHQAVLVSDGAPALPATEELEGLPVRRVESVKVHRGRDENRPLLDLLDAEAPEILLWHISLSSFLHQDFRHPFAASTVGVLTSPVYTPAQILGVGANTLIVERAQIATHLAGSMVPGHLIRQAFDNALCGVIALSETTQNYLLERGAPAECTWVVPPGVDKAWLDACLTDDERRMVRQELGFEDNQFIVSYFGSPAPMRGLHTTLRAIQVAAESHPELAMLILSRRYSDQWQKQATELDELIAQDGLRERVRLKDGFLSQEELIRYLQASDVVALPFELVPSDVPLSILEAMALRKSVIGTTVASIPEMLANGRGFLVPPASVDALADQLKVLASTPGLAEARGQAAKAYVGNQRTWAHMGKTLEQLLIGLCKA